jgi:hypothetical protein
VTRSPSATFGAGPDLMEIVKDHLAKAHLPNLSVPHRAGPGAVKTASRSSILIALTADERVRHEEPEQGVLDWSDDQDDHEQHASSALKGVKTLGPDDLPQRSAGGLRDVVRLASADPFEPRRR